MNKTIHKRFARRILIAVLIGCAATLTLLPAAPKASADPGIGCETIRWGFLGSQRRTICDGPRRGDGSWERVRTIWTPAGYVPRSTYCGTWSCSSSGGYYREETVQGLEKYIVFDHNVLPDEPGWLPPGTVTIK
ncbi:hypothetical protein SEA_PHRAPPUCCINO_28 [Mycobacterium phage Phrappuccino]|uniref:CDGP domain-containing protein n=1 Tax=Mycobacterium phage Phrappuccino TaxID=2591223 RepID=A0A514DDL4_9CAUD|nr:hypothetical protein KHQ87_gp028 [Mycobacterium phage Phrappuccino]QDH91706.1 hypothetical protein SEA_PHRAPPUCCINO_28 [Mycobacterium phage Phrappuccino]QIQ63150.1 hypothetical protein SEA_SETTECANDELA_28 [Mycobacterium phage Settecandela]